MALRKDKRLTQEGAPPISPSSGPEIRLPVSEVRDGLAELVNRVAYGGDRVVLQRHGRDLAALISYDDLLFLEEIENHMDVQAARAALKEKGTVPWEKLKLRLGL